MTRLLLVALAVITPASIGVAQPPQPADRPKPAGVAIPADGTEVFRWLLHVRGVQPLTFGEFRNRAGIGMLDDVMVVVLGRTQRLATGQDAVSLAGEVIDGGGAALVANDAAYAFEGAFTRPPQGSLYRFTADQIVNTDPNLIYDGKPDCPLAVPRAPPRRLADPGPEWGLFAGLSRVATNRPAALNVPSPAGEFGSVVAGFPQGTLANGRRINTASPANALAAGGSGPHPLSGLPYRFLAVADPNVFTNELMVPIPGVKASDNLAFANRVVTFLVQEGGEDRRKLCLFVENGQVVERFDTLKSLLKPPPPPLPIPNLIQLQEKIVDAADQIVDKLQENDALNRGLLPGDEARRRSVVREIAEYLLVVAAVWAGFAVLRRVWGARHPTDRPPAAPGGRPVVREGSRPAGVFDRRQKELLRRDDLAEPVRAAVRDMFRAAGAPADAGTRLPQVRVSDEVGRPDTLLAALEDLWKIGFGRPARITARQWAAVEPLFVRAAKAHADGKWAFDWHDPA